jgi:hypothetical protein
MSRDRAVRAVRRGFAQLRLWTPIHDCKNSRIAGHGDAAANRASLASLNKTCKLDDVRSSTDLADILKGLVDAQPTGKIDEFLPRPCAPSAKTMT